MRVRLYLRVSTDGQTVENQRRELTAALQAKGHEITGEYKDEGVSGSKGRDKRPGLHDALSDAVRGSYDMLAAWSVDRLGRSVVDLLSTLAALRDNERALYLHKQALDTSTAAGRMLFGMLSVIAEFEREMIRERTLAGLARARENGVRLGAPTKYSVDIRDGIKSLRSQGKCWREISATFNVPVRTCRAIVG